MYVTTTRKGDTKRYHNARMACRCVCPSAWKLQLRLWLRFRARIVDKRVVINVHLHYMTLHYITLRYVTLRSLRYVALHYLTLHVTFDILISSEVFLIDTIFCSLLVACYMVDPSYYPCTNKSHSKGHVTVVYHMLPEHLHRKQF